MHQLRFLVSRRWIAFALVVVFLAWVAWRLGEWQFHRLDDRRERNAIIERNEKAGPQPIAEVLAPGEPVAAQSEWRIVEATGTYAVDDTVIVRYRTREGEAGVDVVVPLELADGTSVLVDRGWYATDNRGATTEDVPAPPDGEVTVTGWVRRDAEGDSTEVSSQSTRAVNSVEIGDALGREVLGGWVDLRSRVPRAGRGAAAGRAAGARQRAALLLRPAVVVLRGAGGLRVRLPRVRRAARRSRSGEACRGRGQAPAARRKTWRDAWTPRARTTTSRSSRRRSSRRRREHHARQE